ncbi:tonB-system energizer ExbB [Sphingomonas sp. YL-JM2C]
MVVLAVPIAAFAQDIGTLPQNLTAWGMFMSADWVVKGVILALAAASVVTWTVLVAKSLELSKAAAGERKAFTAIDGARSLSAAAKLPDSADSPLIAAAVAELKLSADALDDHDGLKERVASRFERIEAALSRRMTKGTTPLGTIGATAPFVGLFGTVWGIMHSFIGISQHQTTNLAVVAPGIAEALLATAIGLIAAIPAVVIYNHFARQIAAYRASVADNSAAVLRLVSRDLSRGIAGKADIRAAE